jgi:hypothetical protein
VTARFTLLIAILAQAVSAQSLANLPTNSLSVVPPQQWEIPALGYGPGAWSMLRFTNNSDTPAAIQADIYCGPGTRLPLAPTFNVQPRKTLDIRIDAPTKNPIMCWARVNSGMGPPSLQLQASIETLKGNQLEDFDRQPARPTANASWAILGAKVAGQQLYVLNASEAETTLTFCSANKPDPKACEKKGSTPIKRVAGARQAVLIDVKKFTRKYLITLSSHPGRTIIEVFNDDPGHRRVYTAESSISFDTPDDTPGGTSPDN